ncbi:MAG: EFR1 family ferrodoxin [Chloroflexota bacterium]|nr:EFR1 family ferrodoxin [Chloroflexota bacterium]
MRTTIYYFSGSGNSLFIARELQKRAPDSSLVPMVSLLHQEHIMAESEIVGFVFPVHCTTLPVPVKEFLTKLDVTSTHYLFVLVTQGGAWPRLVELHLEQMINEKGKCLNAFFSLKMPWASPVGLMPVYIPGLIDYPQSKEKILELDTAAQKKLDSIQSVIREQKSGPKDDFPRSINLSVKRVVCKLMGPATQELEKNNVDFYADADCTGCGLCEQVCLSRKIKMVEGEPVWQEEVQCYFCYACFNFCPLQSVMVRGIYAKKGERYRHPHVTAAEIGLQKK